MPEIDARVPAGERLLSAIIDRLDSLLDTAPEVVRAFEDLTAAVLKVDGADHQRARQLLREAIALFTNPDASGDLGGWLKATAQYLIPPSDPRPTPTGAALPEIQRDQE